MMTLQRGSRGKGRGGGSTSLSYNLVSNKNIQIPKPYYVSKLTNKRGVSHVCCIHVHRSTTRYYMSLNNNMLVTYKCCYSTKIIFLLFIAINEP